MKKAMSIPIATALMASVAPVLTWRDKHAMPEGRSGGAAGRIENKLVYGGGTTWRNGAKVWLNETLFYDFEHDTWSSGPPLPEPIAYGACLATDGSLEILGGTNESGPSRKCWRLNAAEQAWTESGSLPADGVFAKAVPLRGRVYLFGGSSSATDLSHLSDSVFRRDESGKWTRISEMPQGQSRFRPPLPPAMKFICSAVFRQPLPAERLIIATPIASIRKQTGGERCGLYRQPFAACPQFLSTGGTYFSPAVTPTPGFPRQLIYTTPKMASTGPPLPYPCP